VDGLISITLMALKTLFCFVILLFTEWFLGGSLDVMIRLFVSLCKSLGISIIFVLFLLNGGEWCKLWSMGGKATTKGMWDFKLNILAGFVWIWCCRDCIQNG
jgi:hypothetical protein